MIDSLTGIVLEKAPGTAVVACGGVGYRLLMPVPAAGSLPAVGSEGTVYTHLNVTENDIALFGFESPESRGMFRLLIGVSGVGPKVGLAILSALPAERVALAVSAGDAKAFTAAQGVGPKLASRLILELKDKVGQNLVGAALGDALAPAADAGALQQAVAALVGLGYTQSEAAAAVGSIDPTLPAETIIRLALRGIGGG